MRQLQLGEQGLYINRTPGPQGKIKTKKSMSLREEVLRRNFNSKEQERCTEMFEGLSTTATPLTDLEKKLDSAQRGIFFMHIEPHLPIDDSPTTATPLTDLEKELDSAQRGISSMQIATPPINDSLITATPLTDSEEKLHLVQQEIFSMQTESAIYN